MIGKYPAPEVKTASCDVWGCDGAADYLFEADGGWRVWCCKRDFSGCYETYKSYKGLRVTKVH